MESEKLTKRNIKPFNGEKYAVWKFRVRALLAEENALNVLDDEEPDVLTEKWKKSERIAKGIIIEHLSDQMLSFATESETAKAIVQKLDSIYDRKSLATQLAMEKKLLTFKYRGDTPLANHFMLFDEMIVELQAAGASLNEMSKIARLLLTLPASYDSVVTAIQTMSDENLSLGFVKIRLLDYEVKLNNEQMDTSGKVLLSSTDSTKRNQKPGGSKGKWKKFKSTHQQKFSRAFKTQYQRRGYDGHSKSMKCDHCGRRNHEKKNCYYYKKTLQVPDECPQRVAQNTLSAGTSGSFVFGAATTFSEFNNRTNSREVTFLLDSGATDHLVNSLDYFSTVVDLPVPLKISIAKKNESISALKRGSINVITNLGVSGTLENVLYVPDIPYNLLSVRRIQEAGMSILFSENGQVTVRKDGAILLTGKSKQNLIVVDFIINNISCNQVINDKNELDATYQLWHARMGHIDKLKFLEIKRNNLFLNMEPIKHINPSDKLCEACIYGKQFRLPFSKTRDRSHVTRPLFIVHTDVCGPITPSTIDEKNYFVTFIDEFTHYTVVYLLQTKSEVFNTFQDFLAKSENHFNLKLAYLYCDNGKEYLSNEFKSFCGTKGIQYHLTVPYTPQQNAVAERMNRTLTEKARAMIHGAELGKELWGEAVLTAAYLLNLTPTKSLSSNKTPFELWHNKKPKLDHLKIFGSTVYVHDKNRKNKFDKKSYKGVLVGYTPSGYKVLNVETNNFVIVRDIIVDEVNFKTSRPTSQNDSDLNDLVVKRQKQNHINVDESNDLIEVANKFDVSKSDDITISTNSFPDTPNLRRSARLKGKPIVSYNENDSILNNCYISAQSVIGDVPQSYAEVKNRDDRDQWEKAINDEYKSLIENNTWTIIPRPNDKNIVSCKWVFAIKRNANSVRYKARLVARGFSQQYYLDYFETFAPVARITTFRIIVAFANQYNLLIHQMDVKTAFLNGELHEEIYMMIPEGVKAKENHVCKLNKALYGLKQAARCWFQHFDTLIKELGFESSSVDRCLYILDKGNISENIYLLLYVDDIIIVTYKIDILNKFKHYLQKQFSMTDLEEIKMFLGIRVNRINNIITLDQTNYLEGVLSKFNMTECNPINTPLPTKLDYVALNKDEFYDAPCKNLIGCLMYAMLCTRPDLCMAVNILSRYQTKNNKELWQNLKRILRYIKGSINLKLVYKRNDFKNILYGYVDADWANDQLDRKSTTGYIFKLFDQNTICWNTKRQNSVATSSTEAEYMALYEGIKEACWLKSLLNSIKLEILNPIIIFEDNNGCIAIANNPTDHKRSKHIDVKYHFSRDKIAQKEIMLKYISTDKQLADPFTKPLPAIQFQKLRNEFNLIL